MEKTFLEKLEALREINLIDRTNDAMTFFLANEILSLMEQKKVDINFDEIISFFERYRERMDIPSLIGVFSTLSSYGKITKYQPPCIYTTTILINSWKNNSNLRLRLVRGKNKYEIVEFFKEKYCCIFRKTNIEYHTNIVFFRRSSKLFLQQESISLEKIILNSPHPLDMHPFDAQCVENCMDTDSLDLLPSHLSIDNYIEILIQEDKTLVNNDEIYGYTFGDRKVSTPIELEQVLLASEGSFLEQINYRDNKFLKYLIKKYGKR